MVAKQTDRKTYNGLHSGGAHNPFTNPSDTVPRLSTVSPEAVYFLKVE